MSRERKTIPVCSCATPDPCGPADLAIPLCYECGRLVVPESMASKKRFEVRARPEHLNEREEGDDHGR
jgi:hypothetical protein